MIFPKYRVSEIVVVNIPFGGQAYGIVIDCLGETLYRINFVSPNGLGYMNGVYHSSALTPFKLHTTIKLK